MRALQAAVAAVPQDGLADWPHDDPVPALFRVKRVLQLKEGIIERQQIRLALLAAQRGFYFAGLYSTDNLMKTASVSSSVIAVDGGGTRCRLVLDGPEGRVSAEAGSANVTTDFDAAIAEIRAGLADLAGRAGLDMAALSALPIYLGLAGVTDAAMVARVRAVLPLTHVRVEDDRPAALRGALGGQAGAIAHFGTGSFFAFQAGGNMRLAGGWGSRLGDEGSGFWVGRSALSAVLDAVDGLNAPSALTEALLARFGAPGAIVAYAATASPAEIATLAPKVSEAAAGGDAVGQRILRAGADHIAQVTQKLGWQRGMRLCLTGGLGPVYLDYLPAPLTAALIPPLAPPIEGAVALAREFAVECAASPRLPPSEEVSET